MLSKAQKTRKLRRKQKIRRDRMAQRDLLQTWPDLWPCFVACEGVAFEERCRWVAERYAVPVSFLEDLILSEKAKKTGPDPRHLTCIH